MNSSLKETLALLKRDAWVKPYLGHYRKILALALVLGCCTVLFAAGLMFTSGWLIAGSAEMPYSVLMLGTPLLCVRVFGVGKPVLRYCERLASHDWVLRFTSNLRKQLYRSFDAEGVFFRASYRLGDALGLLAEDVEHIQNLYLRCVFPTAIALVAGVGLCILFGCFSPFACLVCFVFVSIELFVVPAVSVSVNGKRQSMAKELAAKRYTAYADNILGITDWTLSGRKADFLAQCENGQEDLNQLKAQAHAFDRKRDLAQQAVFACAVITLICWAALTFGGAQGGQSNWILAFALGLFPLIDAFAVMPVAATQAQGHFDSIARLNELSLPVEEETKANTESKLEQNTDYDPKHPVVELKDVKFAYPGQPPTICGINLTLLPGQHLALLGKSGSGKTTLAHLLRGDLTPTSGSITAGGFTCSELRNDAPRMFGVCQQTTYLFNDTLRNNLLIAQPQASDEELERALERVGLKRLLERLPEGLDTLIDEAGLRFSGGERHRVALARILLQNAPIVILDEPTVSLDPRTEHEVLSTMFEVLADKTVVLITHHLQGVSNMDRVLFLENGVIALDGTPKELERTSQHYRTLLELEQEF